jgi:hypothetical protein
MIKALWISGGVVLIALVALFMAPAGQAEPFGTLLRTALATGLLVFLGRVLGPSQRRRPPSPMATRVLLTIFATVATLVLAVGFSPNWSVAIAVWYLALFGAGLLLNVWCDAPERYAVLVATFCVVASSLILMVIAAASSSGQVDTRSNAVLVALWPNVTRIAGHPADAAWMWLAWRVADRFRPAEARRPKAPGVVRTATKSAPRRPA